MRIRLRAGGASRSYDGGLARFTDGEAIPCFSCGVCCQRWQPLAGKAEVDGLASFLGLSVQAFVQTYTRPYPLDDELVMFRERDGGCTFLAWDGVRSRCTVHAARPQACRDWDASLLRRECLDGLDRFAAGAEGLAMLPLYENAAEYTEFVARLRDAAPPRR